MLKGGGGGGGGGGPEDIRRKEVAGKKKQRKEERQWWKGLRWLEAEDLEEMMREMKLGKRIRVTSTEQFEKFIKEIQEDVSKGVQLNEEFIIAGTGNHWVLVKYQTVGISGRTMKIFEPKSEPILSTQRFAAKARKEGWTVSIQSTGKQHEGDGNSCGYHVLQWVYEQEAGRKKRTTRWAPGVYDAEAWTEHVKERLAVRKENKKKVGEARWEMEKIEEERKQRELEMMEKQKGEREKQEGEAIMEEDKGQMSRIKEGGKRKRQEEDTGQMARKKEIGQESQQSEQEKPKQEKQKKEEKEKTQEIMIQDKEEEQVKRKREGKWIIPFQRRGGDRGGKGTWWKKREERKKGRIVGGLPRDTLIKLWKRMAKRGWAEETKERKDIKVMSHNIRGGLGTRSKEEELKRFLEVENPDVLMIQETKTITGDAEKLHLPQEYHVYSSEISGRNRFRQRGVITLVKKTLASRVLTQQIVKDAQGRVLIVPIQTLARGQVMWLVNVYAPASENENSIHVLEDRMQDEEEQEEEARKKTETEDKTMKEKERFYKELRDIMKREVAKKASAQDIVIVGMDANAVVEHDMDVEWEEVEPESRAALRKRITKESRYLKTWMEEMNLVDVWRQQHPGERKYTIKERKGEKRKEVAKRIDMLLVNEKFAPMVTETVIRSEQPQEWLSDHEILEAKIAGPLALRDFTKTMFQKQTYDMKGLKGGKKNS